MDELLPLVRAVTRAARRALVVADLPFGSYQASPEQALATATRFMKEGLAHAVKLEGGRPMAPSVELLVRAGIPVMAHIGFTPQSEHALGGYRVQGRGDAARRLVEDASRSSRPARSPSSWRWSPHPWPREVTEALRDPDHRHRRRTRLRRPGAGLAGHGRACAAARRRGSSSTTPTCARPCTDAARAYAADVAGGTFPAAEHSFES